MWSRMTEKENRMVKDNVEYFVESKYKYEVKKIPCKEGKEYIIKNHYSHGCHNAPSPYYGLFDRENLIGVFAFATPCSENVRSSIFGEDYKSSVTELHRLHILDCTPVNTESWFITKCLKLLKEDKPQIKAVISFSDSTEGHDGTIYKATNAYRIGQTGKATFYLDKDRRLSHPRQNGVNITKEMAEEYQWTPCKRGAKNRYLYLLYNSKKERKQLINMCKYDLEKGE